MSGGGGGGQTQETEETKDFIDWAKPSAQNYLTRAEQQSKAQYQPYGGFFQDMARNPAGYEKYNPLIKAAGSWSAPGTYKPLGLTGKAVDRINRLKAADPSYTPTFMTGKEFRAWKKAQPKGWRQVDDRPFLLNPNMNSRHLGNLALEAKLKSEAVPYQNQISDVIAKMGIDPNQVHATGPGGAGGMGGTLVDFANQNLLGRNVSPWSNEELAAQEGTRRISAQNIGMGDTNREARDWLRNFMIDFGGDNGENPHLQQVIDRAQNDQNRAWEQVIKPRMDSTFARSNAFGGSAWGQANAEAERAQGQELGRISENIRYKDWSDRQNNKLRAAGLLGSGGMNDSRYRDLAALSAVGEQKRNYLQSLMGEAYGDFQGRTNQPYLNLRTLGDAVNMIGSHTGYSKSKTSSSGGGGDFMSSLGSGLLGLASLPMGGGSSLFSKAIGGLFPAASSAGGTAIPGALDRFFRPA